MAIDTGPSQPLQSYYSGTEPNRTVPPGGMTPIVRPPEGLTPLASPSGGNLPPGGMTPIAPPFHDMLPPPMPRLGGPINTDPTKPNMMPTTTPNMPINNPMPMTPIMPNVNPQSPMTPIQHPNVPRHRPVMHSNSYFNPYRR